MSPFTEEKYASVIALQARARDLMALGYIVLVATSAECGHWVGYSAFRPKASQDADHPEDRRELLLSNEPPPGTDPKAIYRTE
jgi:hypothetical protein